MIKAPAYIQTIIEAPVKFQDDQPKTEGVPRIRYLLPIGDGRTYIQTGVKLNALPLFCEYTRGIKKQKHSHG